VAHADNASLNSDWNTLAQASLAESIHAAGAWRENGLLAARWPVAGFAPAEMAISACGMAFETLDWMRGMFFPQLSQRQSAQAAPLSGRDASWPFSQSGSAQRGSPLSSAQSVASGQEENGGESAFRAIWRAKSLDEASGMEAGEFECALGALEYKLWIPQKARAMIQAGKKPALVVFLHGCKQTADAFAAGARAQETAERMGFIALCPQQTEKKNGWRCWNWFRGDNQARESGETALVAALARCAQERFGADSRRVFALGLSAGGAMSVALASLFPDVFAACASHSGLPFGAARDLPNALGVMRGGSVRAATAPQAPLIVFQGTADETVDARNGLRSLRRPDVSGAPSSVEQKEINGRAVEIQRFEPADGMPRQELWLIEGMGHAWSGGDSSAPYADALGPDATLAAMSFFDQVAPLGEKAAKTVKSTKQKAKASLKQSVEIGMAREAKPEPNEPKMDHAASNTATGHSRVLEAH